MDQRLWIHNAVIGLSHPTPPWPELLADAGYRLARVEQPVGTSAGSVTVDLLFVADVRSALLAVECKEGSVQSEQADSYAAMTALDVIQGGSVTVADPSNAVLDVTYAVPEAQVEATLAGLADRDIGVLVIGNEIEWSGIPPHDAALAARFSSPVAADTRAIPRLLPVDDASPPSALAYELANAIQSAIEQSRESVTVATLVEQACWGWPRYGRAFRGMLTRKVRDMLREASNDTLDGLIAFEKGGRQNDSTIRVIVPLSEASTQAGELRASRAVRLRLDRFVAWATGQPVPAIPGQLEIEGLEDFQTFEDGEEDL